MENVKLSECVISILVVGKNARSFSILHAYDHEGRVTAVTNALGHVTTTDYDARGNAIAVDGASYPTRRSYDSENRVVSLRTTRDGGENWDETTWTYDVLTGLLLAKTYADSSQMTYTYTPDGLPARTTYPGGKWKELVYDEARNVTNIFHTARSTPNIAFLHDAFGNVTNAFDTAGNSWDFSFASNSALTNEVFTSLRLCGSACQTNALTRLVDTNSRPVGYDLAIDGSPRSRVHYGYDTEGRIATLAATNAANRGFQVEYHNESGYNCGYMLMTPNGAILTRTVTRDPFRRSLTLDCTTRFNNVEVASFAYTFDAHNRPIARNNDRFAYNDRDEITSALIGTNRINRAYDTIGNHVFCAFNSATNFYANNQLNQTTASYRCAPTSASDDATPQDEATPPLFDGYDILSTNKFTWSAQGGLQRDGRFVFAFDAEDQLISVTSSHLTNGAIRVVNAYDYRHRRISKTVYTMRDDSPPTSPLAPPLPIAHRTWCLQKRHDFVYDDWNLIHETITAVDANSTTNITEIEYFWGPDLSNNLQGTGGVGGLLAVSMNGVFYFPVYDNLGNIVKYIDENGNIVASYIYDDFGQMIEKTGSMVSIFRFRFSTKYFEEETNIYYYGYRFYSPILKIWLNRDPIGEDDVENLFCICRNGQLFSCDYLGQARMLTGALIYYHVPNRNSYPYEYALEIIKLVDELNKINNKGKKQFDAKICDFVGASVSDIRKEIDRNGDNVYLIGHGGIEINGKHQKGRHFWRGGEVEKIYPTGNSAGIDIKTFGPNLNPDNIFGCYISARVRRQPQNKYFYQKYFGQKYWSDVDDYNEMYLSLYKRLLRYKTMKSDCAIEIRIYEGEIANEALIRTAATEYVLKHYPHKRKGE